MKRCVSLVWVSILFFAAPVFAQQYVSPYEFKQWLDSGKSIIIVDIQPPEGYEEHHFRGSIETNAYFSRTDEEKKRLDAVIPIIMVSQDDVVLVRHAAKIGRIGVNNAYDYLIAKGVPEKRLFMLEGGIGGWPYPEMLEKGRPSPKKD